MEILNKILGFLIGGAVATIFVWLMQIIEGKQAYAYIVGIMSGVIFVLTYRKSKKLFKNW